MAPILGQYSGHRQPQTAPLGFESRKEIDRRNMGWSGREPAGKVWSGRLDLEVKKISMVNNPPWPVAVATVAAAQMVKRKTQFYGTGI
jgi:hypothetical protein